MKNFIWSCMAFVTLFASVQSLTCNTCDTSILGYCAIAETITCTAAQTNCYSGVATLNGLVEEVHSRGCIDPPSCKNSTQNLFNNSNYQLTVTMKCCNTNLCNGPGSGLSPLSVQAAVGALLLAFGVNYSL